MWKCIKLARWRGNCTTFYGKKYIGIELFKWIQQEECRGSLCGALCHHIYIL